jgi:hypothetical protein
MITHIFPPLPGYSRITRLYLISHAGYTHEPSKISGVMRSLADAGFTYARGTDNCTMLVVDEGKKATPKPTEHVVIGCTQATILLDDNIIRIGDIPLGDSDDVVDARNVIVNGKAQGAHIKIKDTIVLGTGSPAKQDWSKWLR